jgi:hypothetical protein
MRTRLYNFLEGAKTILNLLPEEPPPMPTPRYQRFATDAEALASDWQAVGDDMRKAMGMMDDEINKTRH